jgi:hypothetical protein
VRRNPALKRECHEMLQLVSKKILKLKTIVPVTHLCMIIVSLSKNTYEQHY